MQPLVYFRTEAPLITRAYYITRITLRLSSRHHYLRHRAAGFSLYFRPFHRVPNKKPPRRRRNGFAVCKNARSCGAGRGCPAIKRRGYSSTGDPSVLKRNIRDNDGEGRYRRRPASGRGDENDTRPSFSPVGAARVTAYVTHDARQGHREHSCQISVANATVDTKKNSIIAAPVGRRPTASRAIPLSSDTPSDNVGGLFPGLYQASSPFKWSQCNRTASTGMSTPLPRRRNNCRLPVGHDRDKCRRPDDYPSSAPDNFQVAFPSALPTCYRFCK